MMLFIYTFVSAQQHIPNQLYDDVISNSSDLTASKTSCNSSGIGCPYDGSPIKYVKVNFHFYLDLDGTGNFNEINDGSVLTAPISYNGYQRAEDLVKEANRQLEVNGPQIFGPNPTKSPVCKIPMRLVLEGVYFHRIPNKGLCYKQVPSIWDDKAVNPNSAINVNLTSHSSNCPYVAGIPGKGPAGITTYGGNYMGLYNDWESFQFWTKPTIVAKEPINNYPLMIDAKTMLHELIHTTGLDHPYEDNEDCDDTFKFETSCWGFNANDPKCNEWSKITNNIMDYNEQEAWVLTPCQICKIYESLTGKGEYRQDKFVTQGDGNCPPCSAFFDLPTDICLTGNFDKIWMEGSASFNETEYSIEIYEIVKDPFSNLTNHYFNQWPGQVKNINLLSLYKFEAGKSYKVRLQVRNACGQNSKEFVRTINVKKCKGFIGDEVIQVNNSNEFASLSIFPNPTHDEVSIRYEMLKDGVRISCDLYSTLTGQKLRTLINNEIRPKGERIETFDLSELQAGNYTLRFYTERDYRVQTISLTDY